MEGGIWDKEMRNGKGKTMLNAASPSPQRETLNIN